MKQYKLFLLPIILFSIFSCQKDYQDPYSPEENFTIEGIVHDSFGNPIKDVEVLLLHHSEEEIYFGNINISTSTQKFAKTNEEGLFSMLFEADEVIYTTGTWSLNYKRPSPISHSYFTENDDLILDLTKSKVVVDKTIKSAGYLTIWKEDDPNINYTSQDNFTVVVNIDQGDHSYSNSKNSNEPDIITNSLTVLNDAPLILNWRIQQSSSNILHSGSDTLNLSAEEDLTYYIKY